ncbi:MAG TPA: alpha/beta hydrolase fold domain-containing protein [Thermoanaerobaculia bacterium]|nr:alpha/beta hydrolase fold domain-containing protein [Thermoanaerobaculia bacterium]
MQHHQPWKWFALSLVLLSLSSTALRAQTCQLQSGLIYGTYVDSAGQTQNLLLDLLLPTGAASPPPLVIWIHGGGWRTGSRAPMPTRVTDLCAHGYTVASVDYRFSNVALWPAQIQDVKGAVRWLRAHASTYGFDPGRFGAWGESAGGHLATILGTSGGVPSITVGNVTVDLEGTTGGNAGVSSRVQAVVDWYGATDFLQMHFYPTTVNHDSSTSDEGRLIGGPVQDNPEKTATANAITYVTPDDPPFLVMHGTLDKTNPFNQSELLVDALAGSGVPVDFVPVQGAGHGGSQFAASSLLQTVYAFFDATIGTGVPVAPVAAMGSPATAGVPPAGAADPARPFVSVSATDRDASEPGTNKGAFLIWRTGSTANPLTVDVTVSGTADSLTDYAAIPSTLTFPAGADRVAVSIDPLEDFVTEETEDVHLAVEPDPAIHAGPYAGSRVLLTDDDVPGLPVLLSLAVAPGSVTGGTNATGTVTIDRAAPAGGAVVSLGTSNSAAATVPASVTVAAGATSATFTVTSKPVAAAATVQVTASYRGVGRTASLTVQAPVLSALTLTPSSVAGGCAASTGKITLSGKAPTGGLVVSLTNANPAATLPASVTVAAGSSSATFSISTTTVSAAQSGAVTASFGGVTRSATLTVRPVGLLTLALAPNPVVGPGSVTGTVTLECTAPAGGVAVALSSSAAAIASPGVTSLTIPAGSSSGTFPISTADVTVESYATIKATANGTSKSVKLTVKP